MKTFVQYDTVQHGNVYTENVYSGTGAKTRNIYKQEDIVQYEKCHHGHVRKTFSPERLLPAWS